MFERSGRDRAFTGVAGGIGERLGVDPTVVRLAFVALSLAAGIGVALYLGAYLASDDPAPGGPTPSAPSRTSVRRRLPLMEWSLSIVSVAAGASSINVSLCHS